MEIIENAFAYKISISGEMPPPDRYESAFLIFMLTTFFPEMLRTFVRIVRAFLGEKKMNLPYTIREFDEEMTFCNFPVSREGDEKTRDATLSNGARSLSTPRIYLGICFTAQWKQK